MIRHGYTFTDDRISLNVWAPLVKDLRLYRVESDSPVPMIEANDGFRTVDIKMGEGERYYLVADGKMVPDPASRFQPSGIYGPSEIVRIGEPRIKRWKTYDLKDSVIEEIHVGTFTQRGNYESAGKRVSHFTDIGINTVELMPLNQTYSTRNWGYDGVFLYSPSCFYGRPEQLRMFIDLLHENDINVLLDVVYNHVGPLGNVLPTFGYYFSDNYRNPWGKAFNFDGYGSDQVRSFILQNVEYWIREYNFDGLRLDATHSIYDSSTTHILKEISMLVDRLRSELNRRIKLIAENDRNDPSLVRSYKECGYGFDGIWNDDFHHSVHSFLTGEHGGYYSDYGEISNVVDCFRNGFLYNGKYSNYLGRTRGALFHEGMEKLIVFDSNHDQIGNRAFGERPTKIMGDERAKLFAASVILSPFTPMLFMGEEYGETNPFLFFVQTEDENFAEMIREGRKKEFKDFDWGGKLPDPSSEETFNASKLSWKTRGQRGKEFMSFYRKMIDIRRRFVSSECTVSSEGNVITLTYEKIIVYLSFSDTPHVIHGRFIYPEDAEVLVPYGVAVTLRQ